MLLMQRGSEASKSSFSGLRCVKTKANILRELLRYDLLLREAMHGESNESKGAVLK